MKIDIYYHLYGRKNDIVFEEVNQPGERWIPCSERLPEPGEEYFVTVRERWRGEEWEYHTDVAVRSAEPKAYIDGWDTFNDWCEGQEVEIIAWMPLPNCYQGDEK